MGKVYAIVISIGVLIGIFGSGGKRETASDPSPMGTFSSHSDSASSDRRTIGVRKAKRASTAYVDGNAIVLERAEDGHFYVDAQVNGMPVHFLVDTGATGVALTTADAQRAGLNFQESQFEVVGSGASGEVEGKIVTLDRVSLDGKTVNNVSGVILAGGEQSLLGQSFLSRMGKIEITAEQMVIR